MVYQVTPPPESQDARDSLPKLNGKTRLNAALKRAKQGGPPAVGQWMEFPGYTLSKTIAGLGSDVCFETKVFSLHRDCTSTKTKLTMK